MCDVRKIIKKIYFRSCLTDYLVLVTNTMISRNTIHNSRFKRKDLFEQVLVLYLPYEITRTRLYDTYTSPVMNVLLVKNFSWKRKMPYNFFLT